MGGVGDWWEDRRRHRRVAWEPAGHLNQHPPCWPCPCPCPPAGRSACCAAGTARALRCTPTCWPRWPSWWAAWRRPSPCRCGGVLGLGAGLGQRSAGMLSGIPATPYQLPRACSLLSPHPSCPAQGLSCTAVGCSNLGAALRPVLLPVARTVVAQGLAQLPDFNLQARGWAAADGCEGLGCALAVLPRNMPRMRCCPALLLATPPLPTPAPTAINAQAGNGQHRQRDQQDGPRAGGGARHARAAGRL